MQPGRPLRLQARSHTARVLGFTRPRFTYCRVMGTKLAAELEGQTSINELLDEPIGATHIQLVLPIHVQLPSGEFRRVS